jgi:hypothetical protein
MHYVYLVVLECYQIEIIPHLKQHCNIMKSCLEGFISFKNKHVFHCLIYTSNEMFPLKDK